jgi:hypothetical protein
MAVGPVRPARLALPPAAGRHSTTEFGAALYGATQLTFTAHLAAVASIQPSRASPYGRSFREIAELAGLTRLWRRRHSRKRGIVTTNPSETRIVVVDVVLTSEDFAALEQAIGAVRTSLDDLGRVVETGRRRAADRYRQAEEET